MGVVADFGTALWIHVEVALLPGNSFLRTIHLGTGALQFAGLVLVFVGGGSQHRGDRALVEPLQDRLHLAQQHGLLPVDLEQDLDVCSRGHVGLEVVLRER